MKTARETVQRFEFLSGLRATEDEELQRPQARLFAWALRFSCSAGYGDLPWHGIPCFVAL